MTVYYHQGKVGEVSHEAARVKVAAILANPFLRHNGRFLSKLSDPAWMRDPRYDGRLCAPGAMQAYLVAAALRETTQGEG